MRTLITNYSEFKDFYFVDLGGINKWIMLIGKIILLFVNFYLIVVIYNLVRRSKQYRVTFIRVLIIYIPLKTLDFYRVAFDMSNESWIKLMLVSLLATLIFIIPILLFYTSKAANRLMIEDKVLREQIINEIKTNKSN